MHSSGGAFLAFGIFTLHSFSGDAQEVERIQKLPKHGTFMQHQSSLAREASSIASLA
uniref:Uncharacterized protein n=1 Tax=Arundo donax TaxID=35708 RepID=A0A0A9EA71_ARUDO